MEKLSLPVARKLLSLRDGAKIPASLLRQAVFKELLTESILYKTGKSRGLVLLLNKEQFDLYLRNHYSISDLREYVSALSEEEVSRARLVEVSTDSKLVKSRSFKGFLVNCYEPVEVGLNQKHMFIKPTPGLFHYIYDFESFIPSERITIVGIENPENFRHIEKQRYLFEDITPLFISRYPQSQHADVIRWLRTIHNPYLHFGDFDLAGINIYMNEFKRHIPHKCTFFIPPDIEQLLEQYGSYERYDKQKLCISTTDIQEKKLVELIELIHRHKKGLDQEMFQLLRINE